MTSYVYKYFPSFIDKVKRLFNWDLETTGLSQHKDGYVQAIQFGAVVVNNELQLIRDYDERCKILPYITPEPKGILTTQSIQCLSEGQSEFEMMHKVDSIWHQTKREGYTVGVTFNGDHYDEIILYHARHRNLLPPYVTSTNGAGKWDLLTTMKLMVNACPEIDFPLNEKGNYALKLISLADLFGITNDHAHDAKFDAYMLFELLKQLKRDFSEFYDAGLVHSSKVGSLSMLTHSEDYLFYGQVFGKGFSTPCVFCGQGRTSNTSNSAAVFDLSFTPDDITGLSEDELCASAVGKSGGPIKIVPINKTLPIVPIGSFKDPEKLFDTSHSELSRRAKIIKSDISFQDRVSNVLSGRSFKRRVPKSSEEQIFDSFTREEDIIYGQRFAEADNCERWGMVNNFLDTRWQDFSKRILASEDFENSPDEVKSWYQNLIHNRLHSKDFGMTNQEALCQTNELLKETSGEDRKLLISLRTFLESRSLS